MTPARLVTRCVEHYDTFQALCDFAGAVAQNTASPSYRALLHGEADRSDRRFGEYGDLRIIRTPRWKLVKRYPAGPADLFNLETDRGETANLAGRAEYAEVKPGLRVKELPRHNTASEAWHDGLRETAFVHEHHRHHPRSGHGSMPPGRHRGI